MSHPDRRFACFTLAAAALLVCAARPAAAQDEPVAAMAIPPLAAFGNLCQGYAAEASFELEWPKDAGDGEPKVTAPERVELLRVSATRLYVRLATDETGPVQETVTVRRGDQRIDIPLRATVLPQVSGAPRVLVASTPFNAQATDDDRDYDPWRRVVATGKLQVHYVADARDGRWLSPELLQRVDTVLLAGPALRELHADDRLRLQGFVCGGGRLVVCASRFYVGTLPQANELLEPFGLRMPKVESRPGIEFEVDGAEIADDPLTAGVETLALARAGTTELLDARARALVEVAGRALLSVARTENGGGVVTLPVPLWWKWVEGGDGNARLLRNLLTR